MRVLEIASEAIPFAKTGGLADVAGALPAALARLGCEVTLVIPGHREALDRGLAIEPAGIGFDVPVGARRVPARILRATVPGGHDALLVDNPEFFDRPALYGDYADDAARWMFFARAAAELSARLGAPFDVVHCHDWQAGLVPALLKILPPLVPAATRTVMTIHNMAYQGSFPASDMPLTGLDWRYFNWRQMECHDRVNLLKTGLVFADLVTTVSPTYAREIQSAPGGCGLEGVLATRSGTVAGIVNGIDTAAWDPRNDPHLPRPYGPDDARLGKLAGGIALFSRLGAAPPDGRPVVAFVGRLAGQKGVGLVVDLLHRLAGSGRVRFVILGTGDAHWEGELGHAAAEHPGAVHVSLGFDEGLAHLVQAAADLLLVPSLYEPCGLTQLYAQRYGTLPVVRATGGLVDTVIDVSPETVREGSASGFVFPHVDAGELERAVIRGLDAHADGELWQRLVRQVMGLDWSWDTRAREYLRLFERTCSQPPQPVES
ncbi:MAG: glycogen synthase GlgA [Planctomycetia bacterium]|nr:glycogen synthase GlgA [Planctomycetia bacterium]